ncbi:hypothetical protein QAD02_019842, partial [Eretmocerus hayati]
KKTDNKDELPKQDDPWAELPYTVDLETGEYILSGGGVAPAGGSGAVASSESAASSSSESEAAAVPSSSSTSSFAQRTESRNLDEEDEDDRLRLSEASCLGLGLGDNSLGFGDDLGLENDFTSDLLGDDCLLSGCTGVDGLLSNDSLPAFNLEEALQLVGLDEVQLEKRSEVKKNSGEEDSDGARTDSRTSSPDLDEDSNDLEAEASGSTASTSSRMIHTPQYHHPHHPHHRSFQSRVPFVRTMGMEHQRWPDIGPFFSMTNGTEHFVHPGHHHHHHHHHPGGYPGLGATGHPHAGQYEAAAAQRNVLLHNATLAPPVGDLNSTGSYHATGGPSNLGSAVATSMNLTNSSEPMGADHNPSYKSEPSEMMYYPNATTDPMNQTTDSIFSALLDEQLGWNNEDLAFNVSDGLYGAASGASGPASATLPVGGVGSGVGQQQGPAVVGVASSVSLPGASAEERMDASSDSAVSSMGSERVPSLSDGEWMETGSNSSHTQPDAHYTMDYNGKYRIPYECSYALGGNRGQQPMGRGCSAADRAAMTPVAQKKHHMFGKRCFQEPPIPGTTAANGPPAHPSSTVAGASGPLKYSEYEAAQGVAAGPPSQAFSGPIEGAAGPQTEIKYSCSLDFTRHHAARSSLEQIHHNHTYHLPPESSGTLQRPISRDKK